MNLQPGLEQCPPYLQDFKLYETDECDNLSYELEWFTPDDIVYKKQYIEKISQIFQWMYDYWKYILYINTLSICFCQNARSEDVVKPQLIANKCGNCLTEEHWDVGVNLLQSSHL